MHFADRGHPLNLRAPFIAHYAVGHFVVVLAAASNVRVFDPTLEKVQELSWPEFSARWSGYGLFFDQA